MLGEELRGVDYVNQPMIVLASHPDFSERAYKLVMDISIMTSAQLEEIQFTIGGKINGE